MSARKDLFEGMSQHLSTGQQNDLIDAYAQEILRQAAAASLLLERDALKEAAEMIRVRLLRTDDSRWNRAVDKCADMIDPDVTG